MFRVSWTSTELFGTSLKYLTMHEGIDSFHGADPHGTVRIPEFLDHCITAMMQAGASSSAVFFFSRINLGLTLLSLLSDMTVEGILRKSGKVRVVREIMHALDTSGGNDTVIDLAALCVRRLLTVSGYILLSVWCWGEYRPG